MTEKKIMNRGSIRVIIVMSLLIVLNLVALKLVIHNISIFSIIILIYGIVSIAMCIIYIVVATRALKNG